MKIQVTLAKWIVGGMVTTDGKHLALTLRDVDSQWVTIGPPFAQVVPLVEIGAHTLADCARVGDDIESKLLGTTGRFPAICWYLRPTNATDRGPSAAASCVGRVRCRVGGASASR